jgi:hypothetical protein
MSSPGPAAQARGSPFFDDCSVCCDIEHSELETHGGAVAGEQADRGVAAGFHVGHGLVGDAELAGQPRLGDAELGTCPADQPPALSAHAITLLML